MAQTGYDATIIQAVEMIGNDAVVLGSIPVTGKGSYRISFKPTGFSVQLWVLGVYDTLQKLFVPNIHMPGFSPQLTKSTKNLPRSGKYPGAPAAALQPRGYLLRARSNELQARSYFATPVLYLACEPGAKVRALRAFLQPYPAFLRIGCRFFA